MTLRHSTALARGLALGLALAVSPQVVSAHMVEPEAAREHCVAAGGEVQERHAFWGTNEDPTAWVDLGRSVEVCRFQADDEARSRIYVDLVTLASTDPSLAAGAYLARVPMSEDVSGGNPATLHCASLIRNVAPVSRSGVKPPRRRTRL